MSDTFHHETILDGRLDLFTGDCLTVLKSMDDESVDCVVTSPPYWALRDYGVDGQIGLEPTHLDHIETLVAVFMEVRRVLKKTGTLWVNYGDVYASTKNGRSAADTKAQSNDDRTFRDKPFSTVGNGFKPKDLMMLPSRLAIALQESGYWLRSHIIWGKANPMPSSAKDRPATAFEQIFLLSKSERYFYDNEAVRQKRSKHPNRKEFRGGDKSQYVGQKGTVSNGKPYAAPTSWDTSPGGHGSFHKEGRRKRGHKRPHQGFEKDWDKRTKKQQQANGRNLRNFEVAPVEVWQIPVFAFSEAHFATFPPELAERCILAGCPKGGVVLDIFGGAGTTALVALRHHRKAQLIELNPDYMALAKDRIEKDWSGSLADEKKKSENQKVPQSPAPLLTFIETQEAVR